MVSNDFNSYHQICGCKPKSWALATRNSGFGLPAAHLPVNIWRTFRPRFLWESPLLGTSTLLFFSMKLQTVVAFLFYSVVSHHLQQTVSMCRVLPTKTIANFIHDRCGHLYKERAWVDGGSCMLQCPFPRLYWSTVTFVQAGEQWSLGPGCIEKLRNDIATSLLGNDLGTAKRPCKTIPSTGSQQLREPCISELVRCGIGWQKAVFFFLGGGKAEMEFPLSEVFDL